MTIWIDGWAASLVLGCIILALGLVLTTVRRAGEDYGRNEVLRNWNNELRTSLYNKEKP